MPRFSPRTTRFVSSRHSVVMVSRSDHLAAIKRSLQARLQELEITSSATSTIHSGKPFVFQRWDSILPKV